MIHSPYRSRFRSPDHRHRAPRFLNWVMGDPSICCRYQLLVAMYQEYASGVHLQQQHLCNSLDNHLNRINQTINHKEVKSTKSIIKKGWNHEMWNTRIVNLRNLRSQRESTRLEFIFPLLLLSLQHVPQFRRRQTSSPTTLSARFIRYETKINLIQIKINNGDVDFPNRKTCNDGIMLQIWQTKIGWMGSDERGKTFNKWK